jgi:hypothetical protein
MMDDLPSGLVHKTGDAFKLFHPRITGIAESWVRIVYTGGEQRIAHTGKDSVSDQK